MNRILPAMALTPTTAAQNTTASAASRLAASRLPDSGPVSDAGRTQESRKVVGQNATAAPDFTSLLGDMLNQVSQAQARSSDMNRRLQMGDPKATVEDTVLAMNTASVQFQMVVQVRNKLVQSYTDIMNMPV